ncbi:MAG: (2Fe-2S)-binding protein [Clostridiales bacterium]|nr:(2Fe-2S)-binding protein [Clostridiales bacterium]
MPGNEVNLTVDQRILDKLPSEERRKKGPYALFECFQKIPCNPCYTACKFHAVKELTDINELPETYYDKCTGCGLCAAHCSGLAVFIIDESYSETQSLIRIPYEYLPLPKEGDVVTAVNREGQPVTTATVAKVTTFKDKTSLVSLVVDKFYTHIVRGIQLELTKENGIYDREPEDVILDESIVCRCEDIDMATLQKLLDENNLSLNELKLEARFTMGPCQGKTCTALLVRELSARLHKPVEEIRGPRYRQPLRPVKVGALAGYKETGK